MTGRGFLQQLKSKKRFYGSASRNNHDYGSFVMSQIDSP